MTLEQIRERIFTDLGKVSVCWKNIDKAGEFDCISASIIGDSLCEFIMDEINKKK